MSETNNNLGLSSAEAARRFKQYGPNEIAEGRRFSALFEFLVKFKNPLIGILIFAALISAFVGDWTSSVIIIAMVLMSVLLDFINTYKSQKVAQELKERVHVKARVTRDGKSVELPLAQIVPGDVVALLAGDLIPADGKVLEEKDLFINESSLTGESYPTEKNVGSPLSLGTSVVSGDATMLVELTGRQTKFSKIAASISSAQQPTEFDRGITDFSYLIMKITFVLVIFIFLINALFKNNILESFLFSAALAVGLTPEMLPMIIALNLSKGSLFMAKHGVIVKRLSAIQNFGSMDILCTDKTGTLTEDNIVLIKYVDINIQPDEQIFNYAYISSNFRSGFRNPLDAAVKKFKAQDVSAYRKIDEIPFDFHRRRDSVIIQSPGEGKILISKGAPEELFKVSSFYQGTAMSPVLQQKLGAVYQNLSANGFRVLGVAIKKNLTKEGSFEPADETDLDFLGFVAFLDPPKKSVTETLKMLEQNGLEIKIITGDNELVTQRIAQEIKLSVRGMILGTELEGLSQEALGAKAENITIFARVNPEQKQRIIQALQNRGHVVGFLGDGINDAPSLKSADVGISVNNAVNVAKDSADLILMNKSLGDLINGVLVGRRTFANTLKYIMMDLSSNFGNMFSMAGASLFLNFLPMLPAQILLNNLLYDTSQFAIPMDNVDHEQISKPRRLNVSFLRKFMLIFGPVSSIFDFLTFFVLLKVFNFTGSSFQTGWFLESLTTQALVIFIIRTNKLPFVQSRPSRVLALSTLATVFAAWLFTLSAFGKWFKFVPLPWATALSIAAITLVYLLLVEFIKRKFYKRFAD
jgi:Mg2+-importing ATPase